MPKIYWYFKLFNSIKEEHEVDLAELELQSLFGRVERVGNFADILFSTPFKDFTKTPLPVQDILAHEIPYGACQGFYAETSRMIDVSPLIRRLAYIREFLVVIQSVESKELLEHMFPSGELDKNVQCFTADAHSLLRFITNQYFLEKSHYISKLSRDEAEVDRNVDSLFAFLTKNLYRIPATATMQVGKRLEDYFTVREEPSLYLTHYMHPYKGRFHPKMVRALLNYVYPKEKGMIMDNFAGCGTLLVEATWMGLDSVGIEINPLSALMSNVKCHSLSLSPKKLKKTIDTYLHELEKALQSHKKMPTGSTLFWPPTYDKDAKEKRRGSVPKRIVSILRGTETIDKILTAQELVGQVVDEKMRDFVLLGLSGAISDLARRRGGDFLDVLRDRLKDLYLRIYIFHKLNQTLKIKLGSSKTYVANTCSIQNLHITPVDAVVNSPPYSAALDYIKNDYPQLVLLGLKDISELETEMIGNPNLNVYPFSLLEEIEDEDPSYSRLPVEAKKTIITLRRHGRTKEALRTFKFFKDMRLALGEMHGTMRNRSKCAIIIGNNHYKLSNGYEEVENDQILREMALAIGFRQDRTIRRNLEKTRSGMIRHESILILEKTAPSTRPLSRLPQL